MEDSASNETDEYCDTKVNVEGLADVSHDSAVNSDERRTSSLASNLNGMRKAEDM